MKNILGFVLIVIMLLFHPVIVYAVTIEDLIKLHQVNVEKITNNISYVFDLKVTEYDKNGELISRTPSSVWGFRTLYRRVGNQYFNASHWEGEHKSLAAFDDERKHPTNTISIDAYDGETRRTNSIAPNFLAYYSKLDEGVIANVNYFDHLYHKDRSENKISMDRRPAINQRHPTGKEYKGTRPDDPKYYSDDFYLEGICFLPGIALERTTWVSKFKNGTARVISQAGDLAVIDGSMYTKEQANKFKPNAAGELLEDILKSYSYQVTVDLSKGASIVGAKIFRHIDHKVYVCELREIELQYDKYTDLYYPSHFVIDYTSERGRRLSIVDLVSFSSEPIPESVFREIWFDEQHVWNEKKNKYVTYLEHDLEFYHEDTYDKDASLEQQLKSLAMDAFAKTEDTILSGTNISVKIKSVQPQSTVRPERINMKDSYGIPKKESSRVLVYLIIFFISGCFGVYYVIRMRK